MQKLVPYLFLIGFLSIITIILIYLSKRTVWYFSLSKSYPIYIAYFSLFLSFVLGIMLCINSTNVLAQFVYILGAVSAGILIYLFLSFLSIDLLRIFTKFSPHVYGVTAFSLALLFFLYGFVNSYFILVKEYTIPTKNLPSEVKIAHLSDVHLSHFRRSGFAQEMVDKVNALNPDFVVITGDLVDGAIGLYDEVLKPLGNFKSPVYFIEGNHDLYTGVSELKTKLENLGLKVLDNKLIQINGVQLIGMQYNGRHGRPNSNSNYFSFSGVLKSMNINANKPSVLLHHTPNYIELSNKFGIDLFLTGHTHAGQFFPFKYITGLMFKYNQGFYHYKDTKVIVSQGIGTFGPPIRVGINSQIVLIKLIPNK